MDREALSAALFARLKTLPGLALAKRGLGGPWPGAADQPALTLAPKTETPLIRPGLPPRWTLLAEIRLWARADDPGQSADQVLNPLIDAVQAALAPDPGQEAQTLGGLAVACRLSGPAQRPPLAGGQALAVLTVEIVSV